MKRIQVVIKNENGQVLPIGDCQAFNILLPEYPIVGDSIVLDQIFDDDRDTSNADELCYLYDFCKQELPHQGKFPLFEFKVVERSIFRTYEKTWVCIDLQHKPYPPKINK